jgi:hypothetical protein
MQSDVGSEGRTMLVVRDMVLQAAGNDYAQAIADLLCIAEDIASSSESLRTTTAIAALRLSMRLDGDVLRSSCWH